MDSSSIFLPVEELAHAVHFDHGDGGQFLYPVADDERRLLGTLSRSDIQQLLAREGAASQAVLADVARKDSVVAHPDEPLRVVVQRMAETGRTRLPVVEAEGEPRLLGLVSLNDLLKARTRNLEEERRRERVLRFQFWARPGDQRPHSLRNSSTNRSGS